MEKRKIDSPYSNPDAFRDAYLRLDRRTRVLLDLALAPFFAGLLLMLAFGLDFPGAAPFNPRSLVHLVSLAVLCFGGIGVWFWSISFNIRQLRLTYPLCQAVPNIGVLLVAAFVSILGCSPAEDLSEGELRKQMKKRTIDYVVDDQMIDGDDLFAIIQPVWSYSNIYASLEDYDSSLMPFSRAQRMLFAIHWYSSEVYNGGHDQFFFNSTGIVWPDALEGFSAVGAKNAHSILAEAVSRFETKPSRERDQRNEQLENDDLNFGDLDDRFYGLEEDLEDMMLRYAREHRADFYFEGRVEVYEFD